MSTSRPHLINAVLKGVFVIAAFWLTSFVLVQAGQRIFGSWVASEVAVVLGCAFGIFLALRMGVLPVACVLAGLLAFCVSELVLHSVYGIRSVQSAPTHYAVMLAGFLGVLFGWLLSRGPHTALQPEAADRSPSELPAKRVPARELVSGAV